MPSNRWHRIVVLTVIALCVTAALVLGGTTDAQADDSVFLPLVYGQGSAQPPPSDFASQAIALVNQERAKVGCPALASNTALNSAALDHSKDMAANSSLSHTGSNGSDPGDRMTQAGYNWSFWAENIAQGYASPQSVVSGWMNSSVHRDNILNCSVQDTGVGYYANAGDPSNQHWWTQVFGTPL